jgi:hypothetical protein
MEELIRDEELFFQRFDLDLESLSESERGSLSKAGTSLIQKLSENDYIVLKSGSSYCGVPNSILIGGESFSNVKGYFLKLVSELGIPYFTSGNFYMKI